jgi:hypothetical protein
VTITITGTPGQFSSTVNSDDYASSVSRPGMNNLGTVVGLDGNDYIILSTSNAGSSPKVCFSLWNIATGTFHNFTDTDLGVPQDAAVIPVPGTKYFWIFYTPGTDHATFIWTGVCYIVVDGSTIQQATDTGTLSSESPSLESWADANPHSYQYNKYTGEFIVMLQDVVHGTIADHVTTCPYFIMNMGGQFTLSFSSLHDTDYLDWTSRPFIGVNGTGSTTNSWTDGGPTVPSVLDNTFFNLFFGPNVPIRNNGAFSIGVDPVTHVFYALFYIGAVQWAYIQAHPLDSVTFPYISGVGLYRYDFPLTSSNTNTGAGFPWFDGIGDSIIGPFTGLDFSDSNEHLDGTANSTTTPAARAPDDYASLNIIDIPGDNTSQYIVMARSYTTEADLATESAGTYARFRVFKYTSSNATPLVATQVFDDSFKLFDTVTNTGVALVDKNKFPPQFIQTVQNSDRNIFYIFGQPDDTHAGTGVYVAGEALEVNSDPPGLSFTSYLDTWWTLSDNAALWAENPWLVSYVDNTETNPSLKLTPRWEWTESDTNHKSGPTVEVYITREGTVSDRRNRIRGKGRALQCRWESSPGQPFNLLGWTISFDKNAQF